MRSLARLALMVCGLLLWLGSAYAERFSVIPYVYDPLNTGQIVSAWQTNIGLPDGGKTDSYYGLYLQKNVPTSTEAAAWAVVDGVQGITLTELGFDYRNDGHNGAGAPRFNVYTSAGVYYFFGCYYADKSSAPTDPEHWTRARFTDVDAYPAYITQPAWPGFGKAKIYQIEIVFDQGTEVGPGYAVLDNIDINGTLVCQPEIIRNRRK